jgi:hypothetical protein
MSLSTKPETSAQNARRYLGRPGVALVWVGEILGWALVALGLLAIGASFLQGSPSLAMMGGGAVLLILGGVELLLLKRGMGEK